ncbi:MAG: hypothetical protein SPiBPW_06930 [Shewanella algae]|nr:hypothetical protein TUM17382_23070 [Shewanella algae]
MAFLCQNHSDAGNLLKAGQIFIIMIKIQSDSVACQRPLPPNTITKAVVKPPYQGPYQNI